MWGLFGVVAWVWHRLRCCNFVGRGTAGSLGLRRSTLGMDLVVVEVKKVDEVLGYGRHILHARRCSL